MDKYNDATKDFVMHGKLTDPVAKQFLADMFNQNFEEGSEGKPKCNSCHQFIAHPNHAAGVGAAVSAYLDQVPFSVPSKAVLVVAIAVMICWCVALWLPPSLYCDTTVREDGTTCAKVYSSAATLVSMLAALAMEAAYIIMMHMSVACHRKYSRLVLLLSSVVGSVSSLIWAFTTELAADIAFGLLNASLAGVTVLLKEMTRGKEETLPFWRFSTFFLEVIVPLSALVPIVVTPVLLLVKAYALHQFHLEQWQFAAVILILVLTLGWAAVGYLQLTATKPKAEFKSSEDRHARSAEPLLSSTTAINVEERSPDPQRPVVGGHVYDPDL